MRFIIQDYLEGLKEREELDAILPDLLRAKGFEVVKLAFRGEVEHGIDIAAYGNEGGEEVLLLIQVKAGDIDQQMWDAGPNSVRATLNNVLDVHFEDLTDPRLRDAQKIVILAHNGGIRENIRARFNGYLDDEFTQRMDFERWGLDRLANEVEKYLLNERILPKTYQRLLKRSLVFLDVPDYDLEDFKKLFTAVLPTTKRITKQQRQRFFGFSRLILELIHKQCEEQNNISPSLEAYEYSLLTIWGWMYSRNLFTKNFRDEFNNTYIRYVTTLGEWFRKIKPALQIQDGLAYIGAEQVEYSLRTFKVLANISLFSIILAYDFSEAMADLHREGIEALHSLLQNNYSRHRPLLDNHSIDIFLGIWSLFLVGQIENAREWLKDILENLVIRKRINNRLPELYNNIEAVIEFEATGERPLGYVDSSSMLIYMLFEFCLVLDAEDIYLKYRPEFEDVNLQVWYPPDNVEEILYNREVHEGDTEVGIRLPESFEDFRLDVEARHSLDKSDYSPIQNRAPAILLLANKYFRTPVFPFWWRSIIYQRGNE